MIKTQSELPWSDCKVAFPVNFYDINDLWNAFDSISTRKKLPAGWELVETDATGARQVAVFRVEGDLTTQDGQTILDLLKKMEKKAAKSGRG